MIEEDFDIADLSERDYFYLIFCGPRGVKWSLTDGELCGTNPLFFTCACCRITSSGNEKAHEDNCRVKLMNALGM